MITYFILLSLMLFKTPCLADTVQVMTLIEPPTNFVDPNGKLTGISVDVARELQKRVGNKEKIQILPGKRLILTGQANPNILHFTLGRSKARENKYHWIFHVTNRSYSLFAKAGSNIKINNLAEAKKMDSIGVLRGGIREKILRQHGFNNIEPETAHLFNFRKLLKGRIKLIFLSSLEIAFFCKDNGYQYNQVERVFDVRKNASYIVMSKNGTTIEEVKKWQEAARAIKEDGTFKKISEKWIAIIKKEYGLTAWYENGVFNF